jgi:hypothetical protein
MAMLLVMRSESSKVRSDEPRGAAEAASVAALEGNSFRRRDLENAAAVSLAEIEACLTRLIEQGRVVRIERPGEEDVHVAVSPEVAYARAC